jgi:hypothetical protein
VTLFYTKSAGASHTCNIHSHRFKVRLSCATGHEPGNGQSKQLFAQPSVTQSSMAEVLRDSWIMGNGAGGAKATTLSHQGRDVLPPLGSQMHLSLSLQSGCQNAQGGEGSGCFKLTLSHLK